ncbi:MAG TPA: efflux RND transporter periplasmic adaptor subunit [Bryobacteraceae bacterium]|nr:efflux RND transporter periplasmic adaptor subunit [Bryobacteraceae bacterium]
MKKTLNIILTIAGLAVAFIAGHGYGRWFGKGASTGEKNGRRILYYVDAMHPWYKSDKPGIAPDCGMKLEPVYADGGALALAQQERKILHYRDPKNPQYTAGKPGINPETGNDLEPVYADGATTIPAGALQVTPEKQQLIGLRFGEVSYEASAQEFRSVGRVAVDETRTTRVHARVEGWIERVHGNFVGQLITKGEPLLTLYSPELLATQQELLLALQARTILSKSSMHEARTNSDALVEAARRRLELWNFNRSRIEAVEKSGKPIPSVTLFAPADGFITARNAFPGQKIAPDTELYAIADFSRVWVMADVFESDAPAISLGVPALVTSANDPAMRLQARVSNIQPQVDPATRTLKVRLELNNPGYKLKPEMFVDVLFRVTGAKILTVASEAVLDSGTTQTVFLDRGNGVLEPRHVEIGRRFGDRIQILRGLSPGERVVVSGAFLLNSESQLKSALAGMSHDSKAPSPNTPVPKKGVPHDQPSH